MQGLFEAPFKALENFGANAGFLIFLVGGIFIYIGFQIFDVPIGTILWIAALTAPIWLPFVLFILFFNTWMEYVRTAFDINQGRVTLELTLPQEVFKSPEAMEMVLIQLHQTAAPDNHVQTYWDGKHPPVHSLEIVSRGGDVRFYMNVPRKKFKNMAEAQLYSQYPGIIVRELEIDYTAEIPWDPEKYAYFSIHFGKKKDQALPIKTYYDYGLNTHPKEEFKIDPITSMLDALASIGPGEFYWVQILIDANREQGFKEGSLTKKPDWKTGAKQYIQKIISDAEKARKGDSGMSGVMLLTDGEKQAISAIERGLSKNAYNVAIRGMYLGKKEAFNPGERIGALITGWRGYDELNKNAIGVRWRTDVDWPWWQDRSGKVREGMKKEEFHEYKLRAYTPHNEPADSKKVMTTDELATIFHLPGSVALTPTLNRVQSTRSEAPTNLPTG